MQYVIILSAILAIAIFIFVKSTGFGNKKEKEEVILKFIQQHPEHSSVLILHNGEALGDVQADRLMPLASFFDPAVQKHLKAVLEGLMEIPANQKWLKHAGSKGGSTSYILTEAMYVTEKQGNTTEFAIFFNRLKQADVARLSSDINTFEVKVLRDSAFRQRLKATLDLTSGCLLAVTCDTVHRILRI